LNDGATGGWTLAYTTHLPEFNSGGDYELVNTPDLLALHIAGSSWMKAVSVGWSMFWLFAAVVAALDGMWWAVVVLTIVAGLGSYLLWWQPRNLVVTLSAETFCIHYSDGETLEVPTHHILEFEFVPRVPSLNDDEPDSGGFVEAHEAPTEALPTLTFGLLHHRDTNPVFGRGMDESDLVVIAGAFGKWLFELREAEPDTNRGGPPR
jgi:hypothetical protein